MGYNQAIVPSVIGMMEEDAKNTLNNANLGIMFNYEYHNTVPKGNVISQSIADGTVVEKNTIIEVVISKGTTKFEIPSVKGMTSQEAYDLLTSEKYGFDVDIIYEFNDEIEAEICIKTNPNYPTQLAYGSHIDLYVSAGK